MKFKLMLLMMSAKCIALRTETLVDIVTSVKQYFHSGCVYLLQDQESELQQYGLYARFKPFVHKKQLPVASIPLASLHNAHCQQNRPLYVMYCIEPDTGETVRKLPEQVSLSDGIWLFFLDYFPNLEELFTDTDVPFNCEFLVAHPAGGIIVLTEVYRMRYDQPLRTYHFGNWTTSGRLTWPLDGFSQRRRSLQGIKLKTGYIEWRLGNQLHLKSVGFFGAMWEILENAVNFTSEYCLSVDGSSGAKLKNGSWSGVLGMILRGDVKLSNIPLVVTPERESAVDFTFPLVDIRTCIIIRKPSMHDLKWKVFLLPFSVRLWIAVGATMIILSVSLTTIQHLRLCCEQVKREDLSFSSSIVLIVAIFLQQGCSVLPKPTIVRVLMMLSHLSAMALIIIYSGRFVSELALPKEWLPFRTFEEFLQDGSYQLGAMRNTAQSSYFTNSEDSVLKQIYKKLMAPYERSMPVDDIEGIERVCGLNKYALATHTYNLINIGFLPNCTITYVPQAFFPGYIAVAMTDDSPYKEIFNQKIQRLRSSGVMQRNYKRYWFDVFRNIEDKHISVKIRDVAPVMSIVAVQIVAGLTLFIIEVLSKKWRQYCVLRHSRWWMERQ